MADVLPAEICVALRSHLPLETNKTTAFDFVSGGCINKAGVIHLRTGDFFLKWNDKDGYPSMLAAESIGLTLLRSAVPNAVPEVIAHFDTEHFQCLLLEFVPRSKPAPEFSERLAETLVTLHQCSVRYFGLERKNYIGSLIQDNTPSNSWYEFLVERRLLPQLEMAVSFGKIAKVETKKFEQLFSKISTLLPVENPSLLHGDLWSGNVLVNGHGLPCLIDPAVYYGHREVDLAMMKLFGGFDREFYSEYNSLFPLITGWEGRMDIYQLYPILVHVNLFGGHYISEALSTLRKYG